MSGKKFPFPGRVVDPEGKRYYWESNKLYEIRDLKTYDDLLRVRPAKAMIFTMASLFLFCIFFYISSRFSLSSPLTALVSIVPSVIPMAIAYLRQETYRRQQLIQVEVSRTIFDKLRYENPRTLSWLLGNSVLYATAALLALLSERTIFNTVIGISFVLLLVYNVTQHIQYSKLFGKAA